MIKALPCKTETTQQNQTKPTEVQPYTWLCRIFLAITGLWKESLGQIEEGILREHGGESRADSSRSWPLPLSEGREYPFVTESRAPRESSPHRRRTPASWPRAWVLRREGQLLEPQGPFLGCGLHAPARILKSQPRTETVVWRGGTFWRNV